MRKKLFRFLLTITVILLAAVIGMGVYGYRVVTGSLARLEGSVRLSGVQKPVTIERDAAGIPTIRAQTIADRAFTLGYLHAQERFFQMDLLRRVSSGELSALVGPAAKSVDMSRRIHQFRKRATALIEAGTEEERKLLNAYAGGVNAGLRDLAAVPIEYYVLGATPSTWVAEDSVLCMFSMYMDLQGRDYQKELARHTAYGTLPKELADFLTPKGCEDWDAPIVGSPIPSPPLPGPEVVNLRQQPAPAEKDQSHFEPFAPLDIGSNNWAINSKRSKHGGAIVCDDMHLGLRVPNIWYRASLVVPAAEAGTPEDLVATGVTLPGTPSLVVGSNGFIAWGFTNSEGDWMDLVIVETDPADPEHKYLTAEGPKDFEVVQETIEVRGGSPETLEIKKTIWGPIIAKDFSGRPLAVRWVAHDVDGANLKAARMIEKKTLDEALEYANLCGNPAQNFTVGDREGRIAWTIMGRIPKRKHDGWLPTSWKDSSAAGWDGYLSPNEYPRVINPEEGRIWTANARVVSDDLLAKVGFGGYDLGARQKQIRDDLQALEQADENDMLKIQFDDRALFWTHWQQHVLSLIDDNGKPKVQASDLTDPKQWEDPEKLARRKEARELLDQWGERASIESVGFGLIHDTHLEIFRRALEALTEPCRKAQSDFRVDHLPESVEASVWKMVSQKPMHLLSSKYASWEELVLVCFEDVLERATKEGRSLKDATWGKRNTLAIEHPLSASMRDILGKDFVDSISLDMPRVPVSGGPNNLPKIVRPNSGASQRMVVSPGREKQGIFHMPTGQSGHPLSPYYSAGHQDWVEGKASPFLPGETRYRLQLEPRGE